MKDYEKDKILRVSVQLHTTREKRDSVPDEDIRKDTVSIDIDVSNIVVAINLMAIQRLLNTSRLFFKIQNEFFLS